jgi:hypothetical protein
MRAVAAVIQCAILGSFAFGFGARALFGNSQKSSTTQEAILAEGQAFSLKNWDEVYRSFKAFVHLDDGALAEGYSDSIDRMLSDDWSSVSHLNRLISNDKNFEKFILKHIDELMSQDQAEKIHNNAEKLCPQEARRLCQAISNRLSELEARIFYQKAIAHAELIGRENFRFAEAQAKKTADLLQTATAKLDRIFQHLSDNEAFSLGEAITRIAIGFEDGMDSQRIQAVWNSFLKHYPRSSHTDKARWLQAKSAASPYEYEGRADAALQQIDAIERFIKKYPTNRCLPEAELELALVCRIAYETFRYGDGLRTDPAMDRQTAGRKYYDRASRPLQSLCDRSSDPVRSDACQALKDLAEGRCEYLGPGSPNPNLPDHWIVNGSKQGMDKKN